jgi:hypothetical protein
MRHVAEAIQADETDILSAMRCDQMTQTGSFYQRRPSPGFGPLIIGTRLADLPSALSAISPQTVGDVCRRLGLPSVDSLVGFAASLPPRKYVLLLRLLSPADGQPPECAPPPIEALAPRFALDLWYAAPDFLGSLILSPLFLGLFDVNHVIRMAVSPLQPDQRVLLQAVARQGLCFPPSLTLLVNGHRAIAPECGLANAPYLDISQLLEGGGEADVQVKCGMEPQWFCVVMRVVRKVARREILQRILSKRTRSSFSEIALCPLSGKVMEVPAKALQCRHQECFDLLAVLGRTPRGSDAKCPICGEMLKLADVVVHWELMRGLLFRRVDTAVEAMRTAGIDLARERAEARRPRFVDVGTQQTNYAADIGTMTFEGI